MFTSRWNCHWLDIRILFENVEHRADQSLSYLSVGTSGYPFDGNDFQLFPVQVINEPHARIGERFITGQRKQRL